MWLPVYPPDNGNGTRCWNVIYFLNATRWTKPQNLLIPTTLRTPYTVSYLLLQAIKTILFPLQVILHNKNQNQLLDLRKECNICEVLMASRSYKGWLCQHFHSRRYKGNGNVFLETIHYSDLLACCINIKWQCFLFTFNAWQFLELIQETSIIWEYVHWSLNLGNGNIFWMGSISLPSLVLIAIQEFPVRIMHKVQKYLNVCYQLGLVKTR